MKGSLLVLTLLLSGCMGGAEEAADSPGAARDRALHLGFAREPERFIPVTPEDLGQPALAPLRMALEGAAAGAPSVAVTEEELSAVDARLHEMWRARHADAPRPTFFPIRAGDAFYVVSYVSVHTNG